MIAVRKVAPIPADAQSVYDGRYHLGWIIPRGERFEAVPADGPSLGIFNDRQAASDALSQVKAHG